MREAIEKMAAKLTEPEVADNIIAMLANRKADESPCLTMTIAVYRDPKTQNEFTVTMQTQVKTELRSEIYHGLR